MVVGRRTRGGRARWRVLALVLAMVTAATAWQGVGVSDEAEQAASASEPDTGTATGSFRPGLTRAGLVSVTELGDAHLWVGLTNGRDRDAAFDVKVELLNDGVPVASGVQRCVRDLSTSSRHPTEVVVPWGDFEAPRLEAGDVLALRMSTRVGTHDDGGRCGRASNADGLRLYYGSTERPSGFAATMTPDPSVDLHLTADRTRCDRRHGGRPQLSLSEEAPSGRRASCQDSGRVHFGGGNRWAGVGTWNLDPQCDCAEELLPDVRDNPPAPEPEPVDVERLPLPPAPPSEEPGSCTEPTGCITNSGGPGYTTDGRHVIVYANYAGAPAGGIYTGEQMLIVKTDGTVFSNGEPWKCLTCGVPAENRQGASDDYSYVQPFHDGRRVLAGSNIVDCGEHVVTDDACTPDEVHIYPIRWNVTADGAGPGGNIRELRLHPDNVHLGWSSFTMAPGGRLDQFSYFGRLELNRAPSTGEPQVPRYDLTNVTRLFDPAPEAQSVHVDPENPGELVVDPTARTVGELLGFSEDGREVTYIGAPEESSNIDVSAADLQTGEVRRLTAHPEYTDPVRLSPDNNWTVALDTRGSDRQMFVAAMRGIPPLTDLLTTSAVSSIRNNHQRRFFQPILIDRYGDRGSYNGQQLNAGDGAPGSASDPNWNASADPEWSPDGTAVVYNQRQVTAPACGGANPLPCPESNEPGGRRSRLMIARLTSRDPLPVPDEPIAPVPDEVPWGTPYEPGTPIPVRPYPPAGTYTLHGGVSGEAEVEITWNAENTTVSTVSVSYTNYSNDGYHVLNGTESVTRRTPSTFVSELDWSSDLEQTGCITGTKVTSPDGFHLTIDILDTVFDATGTLTTTIDGRTYAQPANGT
jgi:hypothetical protein